MNHFNKLNAIFFIFVLFIFSSIGAVEIQDSYKPLYHVTGQFNKFLGVDNVILSTSLFSHALIYYYIFFAPLLILLFKDIRIKKILLIIYLSFLIIFVGLRYEVGGDWVNYMEYAMDLIEPNFRFNLERDVSWDLLGYISIHSGAGVLFINFTAALIFFICLHKYLKTLPYYIVILVTCFPFLIYNFAIGYSRQSVAFGFGLLSILAIKNNKIYLFFIYIFIAASFHKTGLFFLITYLSRFSFSFNSNFLVKSFLFIIIMSSFYFIFLADKITWLFDYYLSNKNYFTSSGAKYRTLITLFAALIYLSVIHKRIKNKNDKKIYFIFSLAAILFFVLSFKYSTFADRLNYYLIPLQLFTFAHLISFTPKLINKSILSSAMIFCYFAILFVQTNYSKDRPNYIPYRSALFHNCQRLTPFPALLNDVNDDSFILYSKFCHPRDIRIKRIKTYRGIPFEKLEFYRGGNLRSDSL